MIRMLFLVLAILAAAVMPATADGRGGGHSGHSHHHGRHRSHHGHHFFVFVPYPYYAYPPPACYWQEGYWGPNQPYIDQYGFERFQPVWVPGQWVCC